MRHFSFYTLLLLFLSAPGRADVEEAQALAPSDIGAFKWIVGDTAGEGEVVILRSVRKTISGEKQRVETRDSVSYRPGERHEGSFVAINPEFFTPGESDEPNWHIAAFGGSAWIQGEWAGSETGEDSGMIRFTGADGKITQFEFTALVMTYDEAAALYTDLPGMSTSGWVWRGSPTESAGSE